MNSAEVSSRDGSPKLYIDEKKTVPVLFGLSDLPGSAANTYYAHKNIANFAAQGIHLTTIDVELQNGWHKVSPFEWEPMQEEIAAAMEADPQTEIILRMHVNPPYWWMRDYPDECVSYRDHPVIDDGEQVRLIRNDGNYHLRVSLASRKWLEEAGKNLRLFCENVWDSVEGGAVLGIQIACGKNGEWHQWGPDRSRPMTERFRRLLHEQYQSEAELRKAWGDPKVTFDTAHFVPEPDQRGDDGIFRDPVRSRDIMDSQLTVQLSVTEAILHFCEIVKTSWGRPVLAGTFYGYYIGTGGNGMCIGGHTLPDMLYSRRDVVDFLCGPFPYMQNRRPEGIPMQRALIESNRLRGMLWLTEMDQYPFGTEDVIGGDPKRIDETVAQLRRNVLQPILAGEGFWYYDHRVVPRYITPESRNPYASSIFRKNGWWDNPVLLSEIRKMQHIFEDYALRPYQPAADVLLVYSPEYHYASSKYIDDQYAVQEAIARTGVAYDCIYLKELEIAQMERYRCVIFTNAFRLTSAQRDMIRERTAGKQVVWLYAPGFSDDETLSERHIEDIVGMKVCRIQSESSYRILKSGTEVPIQSEFSPFFAINDDTVKPHAVYPISNTCAAARKGNYWYFTANRLDIESARTIMKTAGTHIYCESGDPILAGAGLVAINSYSGGMRELILKNGKTIRCTLPEFTTALFDAQSGEQLL